MSNLIISRDHQMRQSLLCAACACAVFVAVPSSAQALQLQASAGPEAAIGSVGNVPSPGVSLRRVAHVDESGQWIEIQYSDGLGTPPSRSASGLPPGVIWHAVDAISITNSVAVSDTTDETWVGHNLNSHRLAYHQTTGDGTPIYEYDLPGGPNIVGVASAEDVSLGVVLEQFFSGGASVRAFDADSGNIPLWTYNFGNNFNFNNYRNLDVSADGSIVAASHATAPRRLPADSIAAPITRWAACGRKFIHSARPVTGSEEAWHFPPTATLCSSLATTTPPATSISLIA